MKHVATTLTEMSEQIANEDLARVCGGFNPQPDPPRLGSTFGSGPPRGRQTCAQNVESWQVMLGHQRRMDGPFAGLMEFDHEQDQRDSEAQPRHSRKSRRGCGR